VIQALNNPLIFILGALLPLGFSHGSTLLHCLPRRNASMQ
jgi:hypothetical protein